MSDVEQERRFRSRLRRPDAALEAVADGRAVASLRWEDYSRAKDEMFVHTDIPEAPWWTVESEDKRRARVNMIAHLLSTVPYTKRDPVRSRCRPGPPAERYERPPRDLFR